MKRVVIVSARRTPFGRFHGPLAGYSAADLAVAAGTAALQGIDPAQVDQVLLGNVLSAGQGMNIARQVAVRLGLPIETPAMTINAMCGSGMHSALLAVQAIRCGEARTVLAGGTESMSQSPLLVPRPRKGQLPDFTNITDSLQKDGLVDTFDDRHMGEQAEDLAEAFGISREEQDAFAERSQRLYGLARSAGLFDREVTPLPELSADQHPRPDVTRADLALLKPVFRDQGTVTAGNSSGLNDGASLLLLADRDFALAQGWPILAEWVTGIAVGCDPGEMGLGPVHAVRALLKRTGRSWSEIDTLEINEAFAAQTLACLRQLDLSFDGRSPGPDVETPGGKRIRFNSSGGAIAMGHPLGTSGARLLTHLSWRIAAGRSQGAIGSLCVGGGMGIAALLVSGD